MIKPGSLPCPQVGPGLGQMQALLMAAAVPSLLWGPLHPLIGIWSSHNGYSQPCLGSKGSTGNFKQEVASRSSIARRGQDITEMEAGCTERLLSALSAPDQGTGGPELARGSFLNKLGELCVSCCPSGSYFCLLIWDLVGCLDSVTISLFQVLVL